MRWSFEILTIAQNVKLRILKIKREESVKETLKTFVLLYVDRILVCIL